MPPRVSTTNVASILLKLFALWFAVVVWLSSSTHAWAQGPGPEALSKRIEIGAWVAPTISWFAGEGADTDAIVSERRFALGAGMEVSWALNSWLSVQPGVSFVGKGTSLIFRLDGDGEFRSNYLVFPLLARLTAYRDKHMSLYFKIGPGMGVLVDCDVEDYLGNVGDCKDDSKSIDYGVIVGAGVSVALPWPGQLNLGVHYDHGLFTLDARERMSDIKNRAVLFSIGYSHHLGGADAR